MHQEVSLFEIGKKGLTQERCECESGNGDESHDDVRTPGFVDDRFQYPAVQPLERRYHR